MLIPDKRLLDIPVMSLQTGTELARTERAVIDPRNLSIIAFELSGPNLDLELSLLRVEDIREYGALGIIVDSSDEFVGLTDVIKLQQVYDYDFGLLDMPVIDTDKHKIGRVGGYTVEVDGFIIQQLSVKRPILRSLSDTEVLIHRKQIISVSDDLIKVKSTKKDSIEPVREQMRGYVNPFRPTSS